MRHAAVIALLRWSRHVQVGLRCFNFRRTIETLRSNLPQKKDQTLAAIIKLGQLVVRAPAQNLSREVVWAPVSMGFQPAFTNLHHRTTTVVEACNPMAHTCATAGSGATVAVLLLTHLEKPLGLCVQLRALSVCWSLSLQPRKDITSVWQPYHSAKNL